MNPSFPDPDGILDFIDHVWVGLVFLAAAIIPSWYSRRNHKSLQGLESQISNGHGKDRPLRGDLDKAIEAIEALASDVAGLRRDLVQEEERRFANVRELREEVDWKFTELNRRLST